MVSLSWLAKSVGVLVNSDKLDNSSFVFHFGEAVILPQDEVGYRFVFLVALHGFDCDMLLKLCVVGFVDYTVAAFTYLG